ncbi:MAG: sigma 54-interacting transcriptional regulator [Planctomycetota bacterium]
MRKLFESWPDGVCVVGADRRIAFANSVLQRDFGDPSGRTCDEYFAPRSGPCPGCLDGRARAQPFACLEAEFPAAGKWYEIVEAPLEIPRGGAYTLSVFRDITARKRFEERLLRSEEKYRQLVELAQEGIWAFDRDWKTTFANPRMAEMLGRSAEELLGTSIFEHIEPSQVSRAREELPCGRLAETDRHEYEFVRKDGGRIYASAKIAPIRGPGGSCSGALACVADLTKRRAAEEALRESERRLDIENRISKIFLSASEDDLYPEVLEVVRAELKSQYGLFGYIDDDGAFVVPTLTRDVWEICEMPEKSIVFPREKWGGIWARALLERRTVLSNEGPLHVPVGHIQLRRALCVPLVCRDHLEGLIVVANKEAAYTPEDVAFLEDIGAKVGVILQSRRERDRQSRARRRAEQELALLRRQLSAERSFAGIVGASPKMLELFQTIREVARVDVPVLIQGESGTGKELVAAAIHSEGSRADRPFVPVNCSALPESLLESELFGHVRGAFTGAIRDKKGRFELADGGTIFLDEVGDLSPAIQVSLLRVLQERRIERVGDERTLAVDVRVISASNRDLRQLVAEGKFREDLYYRLCVVPIYLPPLRERKEDIPQLAEHILKQVSADSNRELVLSPEALDLLVRYDWPGNVRELQNAIYFASVKSQGRVLDPSHFPPTVVRGRRGDEARREGTPEPGKRRGRRRKLTEAAVAEALRETHGNKQRAAVLLGVSRATLYEYLERLKGPGG